MEPYQSFTRHIADADDTRPAAAFFDLDGTLIATHSVKDIFFERLSSGQVSIPEALGFVAMGLRYALKAEDFESALTASVKNMAGLPERQFAELGEKVFRERIAPVIFPEVKAMIRAHRERGHQLAILTSATDFQAGPLARHLGIENVLCTRLEVRGGRYTGEIEGDACYGEAKLARADAFAAEQGIELEGSYFYSNGAEDLPLLEAIGHPVAINPDKNLLQRAEWMDWPVYRLESRGSTGVVDVARTLSTFSSVLPAFLAGLPLRVLGGSEHDSLNFSIATWSALATIIAGLRLIVEGEEHLWSNRPAVFLFNHQSAIDTVILARLIRQDMVGIAKKEIRRQPIMGPALSYAGTVFIDRERVSDPKTALQPAVDALARGNSVVIAPEGTRSRDGKVGRFKTGGFHLAMQAGVPIVPIVIHNAMDALPSGSMVVRPAEVKVTVLEPIPTRGWTARSVRAHCRQVRQAYLDILGQAGGDAR